MKIGVAEIINEEFGVDATPGKKIICPFCGHRTFSIKKDDSVAKCFHPSCNKSITPSRIQPDKYGIGSFLAGFYRSCKDELLRSVMPKLKMDFWGC